MPQCSNPYNPKGDNPPVPCGKCPACLTNRKQLWTHRIMLESYLHENNSFVTLTYNDDHFPENSSLNFDHLKKFFHRLRKRFPPKTYRYYAIGEYGTSGDRKASKYGINPHYHICLFGIGEEKQRVIAECWTDPKTKKPYGFTYTGTLTPQSAAYVAGYVQKKNEYNKQMYEELGIKPEQARMSNRPGIGAKAAKLIAEQIKKHPETLTQCGDVPISLNHGKRTLPLGRYIREKIREELNMDHTLQIEHDPHTGEVLNEKKIWHAKERQKDVYKTELQLLQKNTQKDQKLPEDATISQKTLLIYLNKQANLNFLAKDKLNQKEGIL